MIEMTSQQKVDALLTSYTNQTELLRELTKIDIQIFVSYITMQLALGAWFIQYPICEFLLKLGITIIDLVLSTIACFLLYNDYRRRKEVVETIKNLSAALRFDRVGYYIDGQSLNPQYAFRPWIYFYVTGIVVAFHGFMFIIFGKGWFFLLSGLFLF